MATPEIIDLQLATTNAPLPEGTTTSTSPLLPDVSLDQRMAHFPEEVYDLRDTSHLKRLMTVLLGDSGVGQARKRMLLNRLNQTIQGTHFYDLDRFYGALFGVRRVASEFLNLDPATDLATSEQWAVIHAKDASYRSRIIQFARAITYGGTPTGMELVAEALLSVDCDVYETFIQADSSYRTNAEIESGYTTYADMEGVSYSVLEGAGLARLAGDDRRTFVVRPKRPISASESYELTRVLDQLKPADSRFTIDTTGVAAYVLTPIRQGVADSNFWEVTTSVVPTKTYSDSYITLPVGTPPQVPQPVPKPPFVRGQSVQWSYATDVVGVSASEADAYVYDPSLYFDRNANSYYENYDPYYNPAQYLSGFYDPHNYPGGYWPYYPNYTPPPRSYYVETVSPYQGLSLVYASEGPQGAGFYSEYDANDNGTGYFVGSQLSYTTYHNSEGYYNRYNYNTYVNTGPYYGWDYKPYYWLNWFGRVTYTSLRTAVVQRSVDAKGQSVEFRANNALVPAQVAESIALSKSVSVNTYWGQSQHTYPDLPEIQTGSFGVDELTKLLNGNYGPKSTLEDDGLLRFWQSARRYGSSNITEIVEIRLAETKPINQVSYEVSSFPHTLEIAIGDENGNWDVVSQDVHDFCSPRYFQSWSEDDLMPWQHAEPGHFTYKEVRFEQPIHASKIRVHLTRIDSDLNPQRYNPQKGFADDYEEFDYSLAIKNFNLGYAVASIQDLPVPVVPAQPTVIAVTSDILGSRTEYSLRQERASDMVDRLGIRWTSEPQPVSFAVVNFYLDVRDDAGNPGVVDRFYMDPTHPGPHMTIYYSNDLGEPSKDNTDFYNTASWTPINRDYTLQKGYVQVPATLARHFKFEFTALTAEPFDTVLPMRRTVRLFPVSLVDQMEQGFGLSDEARNSAFLDSGATPISYRDASLALRNTTVASDGYSPTEAVHTSPDGQGVASDASRIFQFQPWHQGGRAPFFTTIGKHTYDTVEIDHVDKVGYSVGLVQVIAFRQDFGADDDTQVYIEPFHDFQHVQPGFTFQFDPNSLSTQEATDCVAQSTVYASRTGVRAIQFATQQTPAIQVVPDDDFRDPANVTNTWTDVDKWHKVGDAILVYMPAIHSVQINRYATPRPIPHTHTGYLTDRVVHPVFSSREATSLAPLPVPAIQMGGLATPLLGVSAEGQVHAAYRLTIRAPLTEPFYVEIVSGDTVLASKQVVGVSGTAIEDHVSYRLQGEAYVQARIVQYGPSNDVVELDTLSVFDEGIVWDFSVNGGTDWVRAVDVRNNRNGILTFPEPGPQLVWRARCFRQHMAISAIKIRPEYVGAQNARYDGAQRGPNVSTYDQDVPVQEDPLFTDWTSAIPQGWFSAYKRFAALPIDGIPNVTEFARFYGRPTGETVPAAGDSCSAFVLRTRTGTERMDFFQPISDGASHGGSHFWRTAGDPTSIPTDSANPLKLMADPARLVNRMVHPV